MRLFPYLYSLRELLSGGKRGTFGNAVAAAKALGQPVTVARSLLGTSRRALRRDVVHRNDLGFYCGLELEDSRGEIRLVSQDPTVFPAIKFHYMTEDRDCGACGTAFDSERTYCRVANSRSWEQSGRSSWVATLATTARSTNGSSVAWALRFTRQEAVEWVRITTRQRSWISIVEFVGSRDCEWWTFPFSLDWSAGVQMPQP